MHLANLHRMRRRNPRGCDSINRGVHQAKRSENEPHQAQDARHDQQEDCANGHAGSAFLTRLLIARCSEQRAQVLIPGIVRERLHL